MDNMRTCCVITCKYDETYAGIRFFTFKKLFTREWLHVIGRPDLLFVLNKECLSFIHNELPMGGLLISHFYGS